MNSKSFPTGTANSPKNEQGKKSTLQQTWYSGSSGPPSIFFFLFLSLMCIIQFSLIRVQPNQGYNSITVVCQNDS